MGFRINKGVFQFKDGTKFINKFKIDDAGEMVEVDAEGNAISAYMRIGDKATDADKLDGIDSGSFIRSNADDNVSANTEWQDNKQIRLGNGADLRIWHDGNNHVFRSYHHGANYYFQLEDNEGTNRNAIQLVGNTSRSYVILYEDGNERLRTTSDGVQIGKLSVGATTGTWITSSAMPDAIGWNTSHGVYIGSNIGGTHYLRGNGTFTTGGSTYKLWHEGNDGSGSGLDADLLDGSHKHEVGNRDYTRTAFYVDGDENTYYPVLITPRGGYAFNRWSISRRYNWTAPWDPIGTGSHKGGLTFDFYWAADTAWGGNDKSIRIHQFSEQYTTMVGGIALARTGGMIVWLRGGRAYYELQVDTAQATVDVKLDGWTDGSGTRFDPTGDVNEHRSSIWNNYPVRNGDDLYINNRPVATEQWVDDTFLRTTEKAADSNLLDGINSTSFLRSDVADTMSGNLTLKYSTANSDDYHALDFAAGSNDYIIKASSTRGAFGRKSFGWHVDTASAFGVYSNGWTKLFGVEGGTGNAFATGSFNANQLTVSGSTNSGRFYADEWGIKIGTSSGHIQFGPANNDWAHIYTDRPNFYFNKNIYVSGAKLATQTYASDLVGGVNTRIDNDIRPAIDTAQSTADSAVTAAAAAQATADVAETRANGAKQASADALAAAEAAQTTADSKLGATAKAADSNLLDGIDSGRFYRRLSAANGTAGAGWITVATCGSGRYSGEVYVTDGDSGDHAFIRIHWMRSYQDSNFSVLNCGGHSNRITGARVLYQTSDNTYGVKLLQVYVTTSSNYYVRIHQEGDTPNFATPSAVTPVVENTKSGYALHGNELTNLDDVSLATEEGIRVGGTAWINAINTTSGDIENAKGSYLHLGGWGQSRTHSTAVLVNTAYRTDILSTARNFTIGNTTRSFNGSGNVSWTLAQIGAEAAGAAATVERALNNRVDDELKPDITTAQTTANNAVAAAAAAQSTADTAETRANGAKTDAANALTVANSKLGATAKAADSDKLDGYDWGQSGKNVRATEFYADNWFRNYNSKEGLYNQATGQHWYSDDDDYWNIAGGSAANGIRFRDEHDGTIRGYVYANNSNQIGFLDAGGSWAIKHTNDSRTEFYDADERVFSIGQGGHGSNFGTVCTHGGGRGGYEGYSINERFVWMSKDSALCGIYNDMDNEWMTIWRRNGATELHHNGSMKLTTNSGGVSVTGTVTATTFNGSLDWNNVANTPTIPNPVTFNDQTTGDSSTLASMKFDGRAMIFTMANGASFSIEGVRPM
jgi:hypothetical protein